MAKAKSASTVRRHRGGAPVAKWDEWVSGSDAPRLAEVTAMPAPANEDPDRLQAKVAELAYRYWQERGCPHGSPEVDWLRAEMEIRSGQTPLA